MTTFTLKLILKTIDGENLLVQKEIQVEDDEDVEFNVSQEVQKMMDDNLTVVVEEKV
jgi:hypothetical protein